MKLQVKVVVPGTVDVAIGGWTGHNLSLDIAVDGFRWPVPVKLDLLVLVEGDPDKPSLAKEAALAKVKEAGLGFKTNPFDNYLMGSMFRSSEEAADMHWDRAVAVAVEPFSIDGELNILVDSCPFCGEDPELDCPACGNP